MVKNKIVAGLVVSVILISGLLVVAERGIGAEVETPDISSKLDEILGNQKTILQQLSSIKDELGIIKIRISQQQ